MLTALVFAILACPPSSASIADKGPRGLQSTLQASVRSYSLSELGLGSALVKVATDFQLPMGIEWISEPAALRTVKLSLRNTTVRAVIQSVVRSQPGYGFEVRDGVAHVFPRSLVSDRRNFLNLPVARFQVRDEPAGMASARLRAFVGNSLSPLPPGAGEAIEYAGPVGERSITLQVENATVRDTLDRLAQAGDLKVWVVTFSSDPTLTQTGFRRTLMLPGGRAVPDSAQPVWDFLPWGQPLRSASR